MDHASIMCPNECSPPDSLMRGGSCYFSDAAVPLAIIPMEVLNGRPVGTLGPGLQSVMAYRREGHGGVHQLNWIARVVLLNCSVSHRYFCAKNAAACFENPAPVSTSRFLISAVLACQASLESTRISGAGPLHVVA